MTPPLWTMLLALSLLSAPASAFLAPPQTLKCHTTSSLMASTMDPPPATPFQYSQQHQHDENSNNPESIMFEKTFQLEEYEDNANCITEVWLLPDHTIQVGQSDGPVTASVHGSWSYEPHLYPPEYAFAMKLHRTFTTGYKGTDMGEFAFTVSRLYVGSLTEIGGSVLGVEGNIYHNSEGGDDNSVDGPMGNVGFFSMIDTTPSEDEDEDGNENDGFGNNPFMMRTQSSF